jgi:hypothetical protein
MRRLIVTLVVLVLLAVAVDRVAWFLAEREITQRIQSSGQVGGTPSVQVDGFPFLTQVAAGKYDRIAVSADRVAVPTGQSGPGGQVGLTIDEVSGEAEGIHISASDIARQRKVPVPVDRIHTEGYVSFASLNAAAKARLGDQLSVTMSRAPSGKVAVNGRITTLFGPFDVNGEAGARIVGGNLVLDLVPTSSSLPAALQAQVTKLFGISYPLPAMPFGLKAEKLVVEQDRITFSAGATDTVIDPATLEQSAP